MSALADLVLIIHFALAGFIAAGFLLIPIGAATGWRWVRKWHLRLAHAGAIVLVAAESLAGIACPLTVWEGWLRGDMPADGGFVGRWLGRLLYWDFSAVAVSYTHLRAHETVLDLVCRLLLEKKKHIACQRG